MNASKYGLVQFTSKHGEIKRVMSGDIESALFLWALQNTRNHRTTILFDMETGDISRVVTGTESVPKVKTPRGANINRLIDSTTMNELF